MAKLNKQFYYTKDGDKKINCYHILVPRTIVDATNIKDNDELKVYSKNNKIIIEKSE